MGTTNTIIAAIFDFDDTLAPDSTSALLKEHSIDPKQFWQDEVKTLVSSGYDPTLAYLRLLLGKIGHNKPLGTLTNKDLRKFGKKLNKTFYCGLPKLFRDMKKTVAQYSNIEIQFFCISGGLKEIIEGTEIIQNHFNGVYACELAGDGENDVLKYIKRCVTFTEKTRYLFEISKGLDPNKTKANPYLVNKDIPLTKRPIPFKNMIYVGDGLTDIPCFSLIGKQQGYAFGVFNPKEQVSAKQVLQKLLKTDRVISAHAPKYAVKDELGSLIRTSVATLCSSTVLATKEAEEIT